MGKYVTVFFKKHQAELIKSQRILPPFFNSFLVNKFIYEKIRTQKIGSNDFIEYKSLQTGNFLVTRDTSTHTKYEQRLIAHTFSAAKKECCIYTSNAKKCIDFCHICKCPLTYMIKIAGKQQNLQVIQGIKNGGA